MTATVSNSIGQAPRQVPMRTIAGLNLNVRPVGPGDEVLLQRFYAQVEPEDLHNRFLTAARRVSSAQLEALTHGDHLHKETFVAFGDATDMPVAVATIAADNALDAAEIAISVHRDFKARGVGWAFLKFLARFAKSIGVSRLQSIESRSNYSALEIEREMGFTLKPVADDQTLMIVEAEVEALLAEEQREPAKPH